MDRRRACERGKLGLAANEDLEKARQRRELFGLLIQRFSGFLSLGGGEKNVDVGVVDRGSLRKSPRGELRLKGLRVARFSLNVFLDRGKGRDKGGKAGRNPDAYIRRGEARGSHRCRRRGLDGIELYI